MVAAGIIPSLLGAPVVDATGHAAGTVEDLLVDRDTGQPAWIVVALAGGEPPAPVPWAAVRTRTRALQVPGDLADLAAAAGLRPEPWLARRFGVAPWDVPAPERLRPLLAPEPALAPVVPLAQTAASGAQPAVALAA